ncbi:MAG: acetylornithine deacetylase, partial [Rhizobiales bacterium]|nr:acetylornithine deacetylase [Hyphomicrobiales bacterium]
RGSVLLSAHLDVVPAEGQDWTVDPFSLTRRDGRLYGRGTTDMKGFAAAMLSIAARASTHRLRAPLKLALSYDEEAGCVGMSEMIGSLDDTIGIPDFCFVGEPTSMQIAIGHKGKSSYRIRFRGSPGHSASAPLHVNALHLASEAVGVLRKLQDELAAGGLRDDAYDVPYTTVHVGTLAGGTALNVVPDHAELEFEIRYLAAEDTGRLLGRIRQELAALVARWRQVGTVADAVIEPINHYPGLEAAPDAEVTRLAERLGGRTPLTKVSYGTEAGFFHERWSIPTIVCGPGDMIQGHKPDEFVEETQLAACDAMLYSLLDSLTR